MDLPDLYILRHGETEWNAAGRLQGGLDSPLTDLGRAQACRQGRILRGLDLSGVALLCSPQGRARSTAALALPMGDIRYDAALREIGLGEWAGRLRAEVSAPAIPSDDPFALYDLAPGGEGLAALAQRCAAFLSTLTTPSVLVTHGVTSRMIRATALRLGPGGVDEVGGGQGVVFHLSRGTQKRLE